MADKATSRCFCGAVEVEVTGEPVLQGYCHCNDCRAWSGTPVTAYALWPEDKVRVTGGEDALRAYSKNGTTVRQFCGTCGGAVMTASTGVGLVDVYPMTIDGFRFEPRAHIDYELRIVDMKDGLPKFRGRPVPGGANETMDE